MGRGSGRGSRGRHRREKWKIINSYLEDIDHVIDAGSGDLAFWEGREVSDYIGLELSPTAVQRFSPLRPNWRFIVTPLEVRIPDLHAPIVMCNDVLFHIIYENNLIEILLNLCYYSTDWIFIYTWVDNPFGDRVEGPFQSKKGSTKAYQRFWRFEEYHFVLEERGFELLSIDRYDSIGGYYVFRKEK